MYDILQAEQLRKTRARVVAEVVDMQRLRRAMPRHPIRGLVVTGATLPPLELRDVTAEYVHKAMKQVEEIRKGIATHFGKGAGDTVELLPSDFGFTPHPFKADTYRSEIRAKSYDHVACGHCRARLWGIVDTRAFHHGRPYPALAHLWTKNLTVWEEPVWCVAASVRHRAQHSGKFQFRRAKEGVWDDQAGLGPIVLTDDGTRQGWDGGVPAWVQCWRCEQLNFVDALPSC